MRVRYFPCNRCGKRGVHVCSGLGTPSGFDVPYWLYHWWYHLGCRACHWHQILYVTAPYSHDGDEALASALRQFGIAPGGLVTRNYRRGSWPMADYLAAGGEPIAP